MKPDNPNRRRFLRGLGAASLASAISPLAWSAVAGSPILRANTLFRHGVASGDPLSDRVILWTRVSGIASGMIEVNWRIASDPDFNIIINQGNAITDTTRDFTVKIDADGLEPGNTYFYDFGMDGERSAVGRTRTLPPSGAQHLRFGLTSCSNYAFGHFNVYRFLAMQNLDAVLHLGDYIYEYTNGTYGDGIVLDRVQEPGHETVSLQDYRFRHANYKTDPDLQMLHQLHPMIIVWDDHESTNDSWRDGAENHNPDVGEGDWQTRKAAAIQAFFEWLPIREQPDQPGRIWRRFNYGDLVELVMLDTRLEGRDEQGLGLDNQRQLISPQQEQFLLDALSEAQTNGTTWKMIGQQVMFGQLNAENLPDIDIGDINGNVPLNADQWDGYPMSRDNIFSHIETQGIDNLIVVTGDIHTSWASELTTDPNNPLIYNPITGAGSLGVEFVTPSVTSPGIEDPTQAAALEAAAPIFNPHIKFVELSNRGYAVVDVTPERVQCDWYFVSTIRRRGGDQSFAKGFTVAAGTNHLVETNVPA